MIGIIDYGMGNLRSVQKALEFVGAEAFVVSSPTELRQADRWILPGVGAFRDAIHCLRSQGWTEPLREHVAADRPLLGICLGLQLLFDVSYEDGEYEGLGLVSGCVSRFASEPGLKIPHMGWNSLELIQPEHPLFAGIPPAAAVYFVHSYHVVAADQGVIAAQTLHGSQKFTSVIARGRLFATQFHPEKSQQVGLQLLRNFANLP